VVPRALSISGHVTDCEVRGESYHDEPYCVAWKVYVFESPGAIAQPVMPLTPSSPLLLN
jgi:hypothetical protein